jgi:hypothetical protein
MTVEQDIPFTPHKNLPVMPWYYAVPTKELDLSARAGNSLYGAGYPKLGYICAEESPESFLKIRGFGKQGIHYLEGEIVEKGLILQDDLNDRETVITRLTTGFSYWSQYPDRNVKEIYQNSGQKLEDILDLIVPKTLTEKAHEKTAEALKGKEALLATELRDLPEEKYPNLKQLGVSIHGRPLILAQMIADQKGEILAVLFGGETMPAKINKELEPDGLILDQFHHIAAEISGDEVSRRTTADDLRTEMSKKLGLDLKR